jgi:hypothetical protein
MDANSGKRWSKMDIWDLKNEFGRGRTVVQSPRGQAWSHRD